MKQTGDTNFPFISIGTVLGAGVGATLATATGNTDGWANMGIWVASGIAVGIAIGAAMTAANKSKGQ